MKLSNIIYIGNTTTATATISPSTATDKTLTWSSSNPSVATVDSNGKVTGISSGYTTITVKTANGKSYIRSIKVLENPSHYSLVLTKQTTGTYYKGCYAAKLYRKGVYFVGWSTFNYDGQTLYRVQPLCESNSTISTDIKKATINLDDGNQVSGVAITYQ